MTKTKEAIIKRETLFPIINYSGVPVSLGISLIMQNRKNERKHKYEGGGEKDFKNKKRNMLLTFLKKKRRQRR